MSFAAPVFLLGLLIFPALLALYLIARKRRDRFPVHYSNLEVLRSVAATPRVKRALPAALLLCALAASTIAAARPEAAVRVPREEATVVLVLDRSGSMSATDVQPSRMTAAKAAAGTFLDVLPPGFQVGVVAFDEVADVLIRPTDDRAAVNSAIDSIDAEGGTAMGDAIVQALSLDPAAGAGSTTPGASKPLAAVIMLSDGFNTAGSVGPLDAARQAASQKVPIYTIALGTNAGVITVPGPFGPQLQPVPPDPETLAAVAETTDGQFFEAPDDADLRSIYEGLGSKVGYRTERREVTGSFVAAGAVLAGAGLLLSSAWGRRLW